MTVDAPTPSRARPPVVDADIGRRERDRRAAPPANSPFGADVGAPAGGGFAVNVFLRDGDTVYRTWNTDGRKVEQLSHTFALIDLLPYGRQEEWQDSPDGWPQSPTYSRWAESPDIAAQYGPATP